MKILRDISHFENGGEGRRITMETRDQITVHFSHSHATIRFIEEPDPRAFRPGDRPVLIVDTAGSMPVRIERNWP
jgi:hypothetical protein